MSVLVIMLTWGILALSEWDQSYSASNVQKSLRKQNFPTNVYLHQINFLAISSYSQSCILTTTNTKQEKEMASHSSLLA